MRHGRKRVGVRGRTNTFGVGFWDRLGEPLLRTALVMPRGHFTGSDPEEIKDRPEKQVDLIIHGGYLGQQPTTVIDFTNDSPVVLREGVGDVTPFL